MGTLFSADGELRWSREVVEVFVFYIVCLAIVILKLQYYCAYSLGFGGLLYYVNLSIVVLIQGPVLYA